MSICVNCLFAFTGHWWEKPGSTFFTPPAPAVIYTYYKTSLSFLSPGLNRSSSLAASSHMTDALKPEWFSWFSNWATLCLSCIGDPRTRPSTPDSSQQYWTQRKDPCCQCAVTLHLMQPESCWTYLPSGHVPGSGTTSCPSRLPVRFLPRGEKGAKSLIHQGDKTVIFSDGAFFHIFYFWAVTYHLKHFITFNHIDYSDWVHSLCLFQNSVQIIWKLLSTADFFPSHPYKEEHWVSFAVSAKYICLFTSIMSYDDSATWRTHSTVFLPCF